MKLKVGGWVAHFQGFPVAFEMMAAGWRFLPAFHSLVTCRVVSQYLRVTCLEVFDHISTITQLYGLGGLHRGVMMGSIVW